MSPELNNTVDLHEAGVEHPPLASMLMQSLRSIGYTTAAALADIIDNSIAAEAKTIKIFVSTAPDLQVYIVDDGTAMDEASLIAAMRFGCRDPRDLRAGLDLGRFGLGLKTASISQCRRLTVASFKDGHFSIARWDMDQCDARNTWWLERPALDEVPALALESLKKSGRGTAIIWQNADRLIESGGEKAVLDAIDHLALTFHRYLSGEVVGDFSILLNNQPLPVRDPFLSGHVKGQSLHFEKLEIDGHAVTVSPFVLPFPSKLRSPDLDSLGGRESLKTGHGFYIYRGGRLIVPGGWFRIVPSDDLIRLARIRVDVPTELDHIWKVDVRKAAAEPPAALRPHLKRIVGEVTLRSRRVYHYKGRPNSEDRVSFWLRHDLRDQGSTWKINRRHPLIELFINTAQRHGDAQRLLSFLEDSLPIHEIHMHTANDQPIAEAVSPAETELEELAVRLMAALGEPSLVSRFLQNLAVTEPFSRAPHLATKIAEKLKQ